MAKENGSLVIGTKVDESGFDEGLKNIEKKAENSKIEKKIQDDFKKASDEASKSVDNINDKITELQSKVDFLSSQKNLSGYLKKQLEDYKKELENLKGTAQENSIIINDSNEKIVENANSFSEASQNASEYQKRIEEVEEKAKEYKETLQGLSKEQLEQLEQKWHIEIDEAIKNVETVDNKIEELRNKYPDGEVMVGDVKVTGLSGFGANATEEEWQQYEKLNTLLDDYKVKRYEVLEMNKAVADTLVEQANKENENVNLSSTLRGQLEEMLQIYNQMSKSKIFTDHDLQFVEKLKDDIRMVANELSEIEGTPVHIKGITDFSQVEKVIPEVKRVEGSFAGVDKQVKSIGNSIGRAIRGVASWALAVFGIRTAYMFVRQAISTLSQYNEQIAVDVEYIRYVIANTLQPVVERIINLVFTLLSYINYIAKAWFNVDLFANSSAENFNKMKKGADGVGKGVGKAAKEAKELKKQLAGFDEMNILSDNKDTSTGSGAGAGAGGGAKIPSFDLSNFDAEPPKWLKWIAENGPLVIAIIAGIVGALLGLKLGLSGLQALGVGLAITGILIAIESLLAYLNDPSWENFGGVIAGIGLAVIGLGLVFGSLPVALAGAIVLMVGIIIKYWDKIKAFLQGGIDWLSGKSDWVHQMFGDTIGSIYDIFVNILQSLLDGFDKMFNGLKTMFDGIIDFVTGIFSGDWQKALSGLGKIFEGFLQFISGTFQIAWGALIEVAKGAWNFIVEGGKRAFNGLIDFIKWVIKSIGNLLGDLGKNAGNIVAGAFKAIVNGILGTIEAILNTPIGAINGLITAVNQLPGVNMKKISTFKLPRLAKGGIVNLPGRGVPVGGAITGENGPEGVIPFTDSQQMELLGKAIGEHINITNILNNYMNARLISRELDLVKQQNEFAGNL